MTAPYYSHRFIVWQLLLVHWYEDGPHVRKEASVLVPVAVVLVPDVSPANLRVFHHQLQMVKVDQGSIEMFI